MFLFHFMSLILISRPLLTVFLEFSPSLCNVYFIPVLLCRPDIRSPLTRKEIQAQTTPENYGIERSPFSLVSHSFWTRSTSIGALGSFGIRFQIYFRLWQSSPLVLNRYFTGAISSWSFSFFLSSGCPWFVSDSFWVPWSRIRRLEVLSHLSRVLEKVCLIVSGLLGTVWLYIIGNIAVFTYSLAPPLKVRHDNLSSKVSHL